MHWMIRSREMANRREVSQSRCLHCADPEEIRQKVPALHCLVSEKRKRMKSGAGRVERFEKEWQSVSHSKIIPN